MAAVNFVIIGCAVRLLKPDHDVTRGRKSGRSVQPPMSRDLRSCVMDIPMPEMDGFNTTPRILSMKYKPDLRDTPIVTITSTRYEVDENKLSLPPMEDYISISIPEPITLIVLF